jgi:hypothetical protein
MLTSPSQDWHWGIFCLCQTNPDRFEIYYQGLCQPGFTHQPNINPIQASQEPHE